MTDIVAFDRKSCSWTFVPDVSRVFSIMLQQERQSNVQMGEPRVLLNMSDVGHSTA